MGARGRWSVRLAAGGAGMAINAGLLALLVLTPETPAMVDPPVVQAALEPRETKAERRRPSPTRRSAATATVTARAISPRPRVEPLPSTATATAPSEPDLSKAVEPRWRVGGGEYVNPETARRARRVWEAAENRRYQRACLGQSNEHMSEEEKFACWDAWGGGAPLNSPDGSRPGRRYPGAAPKPGAPGRD